jgi:hypothetical protein
MFGAREEAEEFVRIMLEMEPDRMFSIESIAGRARARFWSILQINSIPVESDRSVTRSTL